MTERIDLSNPDRLPFKALPDEVAAAMFNDWRKGEVMEQWAYLYPEWSCFEYPPRWHPSGIYRVRPEPLRPMIIPWDVIDPQWTQAARDKDGSVYLYTGEAIITDGRNYWTGDRVMYITGLLRGMEPGTVDWRDSKQTRPEGV